MEVRSQGRKLFFLNVRMCNLFVKDGVMNLNGMDFVFKKALGEADW